MPQRPQNSRRPERRGEQRDCLCSKGERQEGDMEMEERNRWKGDRKKEKKNLTRD